MKLIAENFSRNGHNIFKGTIKAVSDDGLPMGWADTVNIDNRKEKLALIDNLVQDLGVTVDDARRLVNEMHKALEVEANTAEELPDESDGKRSQASMLVDLAEDAELWHTPEGTAFATIDVASHKETWAIRAKGYKDYLAYLFFQAEGKSPGGQAKADAQAVLAGKALFAGSEYPVFTRVAEVDGVIYLDLANDTWQVAEITSTGWRITGDAPVRFRRARGMLALPRPVLGGNLALLRGLLNLAGDDQWALFLAWLVQALRGRGPYPVLVIYGEHGSAKSAAAKVARRLIDPNKADLRSMPRDERDLRIQATNGWVVAYDNLSSLPEWLSNALCRVSTGGGMGTRELYSDDEEVLFDGQRPIILNGIEEVSTRPDLVDRSLILTLEAIPETRRRTEREFWASFDAAHGEILGGLLDAVVAGLKAEHRTKLETLPRMADFAEWAVAAEEGLGLESGSFLEAYRANRASANTAAIEGATIGPYLQNLITEERLWSGTATELLRRLNDFAPEDVQRQKSWPKRANTLSGKLRALAPNLRAEGFEVLQGSEKGRSKIYLSIGTSMQKTSTIATSPPGPGVGGGDERDERDERDDLQNSSYKCGFCQAPMTGLEIHRYDDDTGEPLCQGCAEGGQQGFDGMPEQAHDH